jgi:hypothetical protein
MPLHQSERFVPLLNPERIKDPELELLLESEDLLDPTKKKKTVYFIGLNIHTHEITAEPNIDLDTKEMYYLITWSDREPTNHGKVIDADYSQQVKYYPERGIFEIIAITQELIAQIENGIKSLQDDLELIKSSFYDKGIINLFKSLDEDYLNQVFARSAQFHSKYPYFEEIFYSENRKLINEMMVEFIQEYDIYMSNFKNKLNVNHYYSNYLKRALKETVEDVHENRCIKNPTQSQVLAMKREYNLSKIK